MKRQKHLVRLVTAALFAALCCVATLVMQIPTPTGGFVNLGDSIVIFSAYLLSPVYAFSSAAIGSALADILAGYAQYAPATFIIKGVTALSAWLVFKATEKIVSEKAVFSPLFTALAAICGEALMIAGYFLFEAFILSYGTGGALASVLPNTMQGIAAVIGGTLLCEIIKRTKTKNTLLR